MGLRARISAQYAVLLEAQKHQLGFPGPARNLRWYNSFTSFFRNELVYRMCVSDGAKKILIIGDGGGRDYWYLRWKGLEDLTVVDIAPQSAVPDLIQCDIAGTLPFAPETFDCVIACDILEHLYDDMEAFRNIHTLLVKDGIFVIAGPYWHDADRTHVRIHSPEIIRRTLEDSGFVVEEQLARGGLTQAYMRWIHPLNVALNCMWFSATGRTTFDRLNRVLFAMNCPLVRWRRLPYIERALFGMSGGLNGYVIKARKEEGALPDVKDMSREKFANMSPEVSWKLS